MDEMVLGYMDGLDADSPEPSKNRSASYLHGFANGRDDLHHTPRASAAELRIMAQTALYEDSARRIVK